MNIKLCKWIAKHSILPATIFTKAQVSRIHREFSKFWGLEDGLPAFKHPPRFSTFTLGTPVQLWSYYFANLTELHSIRSHYIPIAFQATTPDGVLLCGTHFQDHRASHHSATRTLIVFGGNGELYKIGTSAWLLKLLKNSPVPFNIVMFDYRECGFSKGSAHAGGLVVDGETIYQYVLHQLHVPEDHIDLYGFSLGAAIATLVKAQHPATEGKLISNRSFQSLEHAVKGVFFRLGNPLSELLGALASKLKHHSEWDLNPLAAWNAITSHKMVICHSQDPVIAHNASLEQGLLHDNKLLECHHIHLHQKHPGYSIKNHHVQPLSFYNDQHGLDVEQEILKFLLKGKDLASYAYAENNVI